MTWLEERIGAGPPLLLDGAIGTELQRRGVAMDDDAWCARAIVSDPKKVRELHADYIEAGADIITANTFANHRYVLEPAGLGGQLETITRRAVALAQEARDSAARGRAVAIAGSMSHMPAWRCLDDTPEPASAAAHYRELAEILADAGCELLIAEMMTGPGHAEALVAAAQATGLPVFVGFTVSCRDGRVMMGTTRRSRRDIELTDFASGVLAMGGVVAGIMHSEVKDTHAGLSALESVWDGPLLAYPNSGGWIPPHWQYEKVIGVDRFVEAATGWIEQHDLRVIGGCCGIGPDHIRALGAAVAETKADTATGPG